MITKISKLDKIGKFTTISQDKPFQSGEKGQNCNIVFGFNGSGKTTISNALSFFSDNSFISEDEKASIFNDIKEDDTATVEIELVDGNKCKYPSANHPKDKTIYIFNSNFISTHVFDGTKGKLKKFSNISGEIKNKEIDNINIKIDELNEEKKELDTENKKFEEEYAEITKRKSTIFGKMLTDKNKRLQTQDLNGVQLPKETYTNLETKLEALHVDYELSKKQNELDSDIEELRKLNFDAVVLNLTNIDDILSKSIQQLSKDSLEKRIKSVQDIFAEEQHKQSVERWFRFSKSILENKPENCPVCNADISKKLDIILNDYQGYFDESYETFTKELQQSIDAVSTSIGSLEVSEQNSKTLEKIHVKYAKLISDSFNEYDFKDINLDLVNLKGVLEAKKDNILGSFSKPESIEKNITALNNTLTKLQTLKDTILVLLESKKLDTHNIEGQIRQACNEMVTLEFDQIGKQDTLARYKNNQTRISVITSSKEEGLPYWTNKLVEELRKIKAESKSILKYLNKMGIDHFDVDINEQEQGENIIIKFKNSINERNKLKNCLSEGEKTALAFAYFLSKFENEVNSETKIKEAVVVVDDPISSLDDNRLYSTAYLIWHDFEEVKQLIVLSHNFLFLKFFNSFYNGKANCLFLNQDKISELPEELRDFETPYFYMLRNISNFLDPNNQSVVYEDAKKYLPNFIRRVLETFLSFKFSMIVNRPGGHRSPGLNEFNDNIDNTDIEEDIKKELKEKIAKINKVADIHSHGNAQHTQENFYISEPDLKLLAQNAIWVIETMDKLHKTSVLNQP